MYSSSNFHPEWGSQYHDFVGYDRGAFRGGRNSSCGGYRGGRFDRRGWHPSSNFHPTSPVINKYYIKGQICCKLGHSATECGHRFTIHGSSIQDHHTFVEEYFEDSYEDWWFPEPEAYDIYKH